MCKKRGEDIRIFDDAISLSSNVLAGTASSCKGRSHDDGPIGGPGM
jgi:hypothetical protein